MCEHIFKKANDRGFAQCSLCKSWIPAKKLWEYREGKGRLDTVSDAEYHIAVAEDKDAKEETFLKKLNNIFERYYGKEKEK